MPARYPDQPERHPTLALLARVTAVLLGGVFAALAFSSVAVRVAGPALLAWAVDFAGVAGIGMTAGFMIRLSLNHYKRGTRVLAAMLSVFCGLITFGWMTGWRYGIGPLVLFDNAADWKGLGQLTLGWYLALLTGLAFRGLGRAATDQALPAPTTRAIASGSVALPSPARSTTRRKAPASRRKKTSGRAGKKAPVKTSAVKTAKPVVKPVAKPVAKKRRRKIVLAPEEEHRCPYCLELVKPNDPRGVVECEICHTLHHADCWAITGTCQVPHYNH